MVACSDRRAESDFCAPSFDDDSEAHEISPEQWGDAPVMPIIASAANVFEPPERQEHREKDVDTPEAQFHSMVAKS